MRLWRVVLAYAVYGVDVEDGRVVAAAPIARWMVGKTWAECAAWVRKRGGSVEDLGPTQGERQIRRR